jgi:DNA-directed RNA polymerase specialized sigma24 family protein
MHAFIPLLSIALFAVLAVVGIERLGRPLTDDEKRRLGALLKEHDYPGKRLIALRYAYRLTESVAAAEDLMERADLRLLTTGWDPLEVPLVSRLCRLVWSEYLNAERGEGRAERAAELYLGELEATEGTVAPSIEKSVVTAETDEGVLTKGRAQLAKLRAIFEAQNDEVNLIFLKRSLEGETDLGKMAAESGRDVREFYAAAKRRRTAVARLLANDGGVDS